MVWIDLGGVWEMRCEDEKGWTTAQVPGSVYQDLLAAGKIENPFYRENEWNVQEAAQKDYFYRKTFVADKELLAMDRLILSCEGLDTICEVFVNGQAVLQCNNMHITWEADVTRILKEGKNELLVHFFSPVRYLEEIKKKHPDMDLEGHLFQAHLQMRKAAYMFGWDWGPVLADMGIWKPIGIQGFQTGRIKELAVRQEHAFEKVTLHCQADLMWFGERKSEGAACRFSVYDPEGQLLFQKDSAEGRAEFVIDQPRLWWCHGYGEQPLYTVTAELWQGVWEDKVVRKIGLRTLELCQEKDEIGKSFYFRINGVEVFARGADYIPEDSLLGRVTAEKTEALLESCIKANFNMIRVWGGGVYPSDAFLDYCDRKGIMVWQDFMFANIVTIWHGEEKENMTREIRFQTRRLREHPCIALLCGNNETELMIWEDMNPRYKEMYVQQYEKDMAELVKEEAPFISYRPSSPSSDGGMKDVEDENVGDCHDWRVWHGELPFTHYRSTYPRFNSEFGLQSFPCMETIESFTKPEDRNIFSYVMENHQKSKNGNRVIFSYISQYFKFPRDFRALIYLSQMIQMEGIRYGVEHWRRNRNDRRCMGTLFWQLNDCWPVASWASVDSFGRWKGLQYGAKRFYEPVLVSACEEGTTVDLFLSNETLTATQGVLKWGLYHVEKGLLEEEEISCQVRRLHTQRMAHLDFGKILASRQDLREHYLAYSYESGGRLVGEGTVLFVAAKHFAFQKPEIVCEKIAEKTWRLCSDVFAKFVEVDFGADVILSDNYFDLVPGKEKIITLEQETEKTPGIYSLYDSFSED